MTNLKRKKTNMMLNAYVKVRFDKKLKEHIENIIMSDLLSGFGLPKIEMHQENIYVK